MRRRKEFARKKLRSNNDSKEMVNYEGNRVSTDKPLKPITLKTDQDAETERVNKL